MRFMENMNPSPNSSPHQPDTGKEGTPFAQATVQISKQEHIQLKWGNRYWHRQHGRALERIAALEQELERAQAKIRDLTQRLYGKHSEKGGSPAEAQPDGSTKPPPRSRGQTRGSKGHGRTSRPHLPVLEEVHVLPADEQACPLCHGAFDLFPGTEDSEVIEVEVKAYVRRIKRQRYKKTCQCPNLPGLITAPPAPRLIPKSSLGVSVWVEALLQKYLYATPTHRLCANLTNLGAPVASGTLTGGLKKLATLFEPLTAALLEKHLTERLFHGDETRWQVFQVIEGKIGYRWYLWLTCSASVVYFWMAPCRGAKVIKEHMAGLPPDVPIIFVCDRYRAYQCGAKDFPLILLAFCWAHVRRDFLDAAKAWPLLAVWMHSWVETIGELYHRNDQRLAVWDKNLPLAEQSPLFQVRHQALADGLAAMSTKRDLALADPDIHSAQKKVLASLNTHWSGLTVFLDYPQTPMDNNTAENSLRNSATGRKNYYGSGAVWSANLAAMLFSILKTLILWGLNPRHWLHAFLSACAENGGQPLTDLTPFLPWAMDEARLNELKQPLKLNDPEQATPFDTS
jgi:transposase